MTPRQLVAVTAEGTLITLSVLTTIALERLFIDASFLRDILIMVIGSHVVAITCRRAGLSMGWSTIVSGLTLILLGTSVFYPDTSALILPTSETMTVLGEDLREAWTTFSDDAAPVPPLRGFLVTTSVVTWYGVFLADWAAFRLRSPLEAIVPATSVFVFTALLGVDRHQVTHGVLYAVGVAAVLLGLRAERQVTEEVWVAAGTAAGIRTTLRVGATVGIAAIVVGALLAPRLPGADAQPLIDVTAIDDGPQVRKVVSPLVSISASLVNQTDDELFSVRVDPADRDYWRLMALTRFTGDQWERSSNFDDVRGPVDGEVDQSVPRRTITQEITKRSAGDDDIYLPVASELSRVIDDGGIGLEYESATGALVYQREFQSQAESGFTYTVESAVPDYDPAQLPARAAAGLDDDFVDEHTQLPPACEADQSTATHDCWPTVVNTLAQQLTASATTDHQRALMLQAYFRDPANFTYDIDVAAGHDVKTVENFLFDVQRGYCEQFASVFAAMARSLGIPSRVAVGFTWGDWDEARGEYVVRGRHAHAWPEVYFAGVGWVVFEPTPGRSRPYDADVTGLDTALQFPANQNDTTPAPATSVAPIGSDRSQIPELAESSGTQQPAAEVTDTGPEGLSAAVWFLLASLLAAIVLVAAVPATKTLRRKRRLLRVVSDPVGRGELAWDDATEAMRLLGLSPAPHHTPLELAAAVARSRHDLGPVEELALAVTSLRYSPTDHAIEQALAAKVASAHIVDRCHRLAGRRSVMLSTMDPRTLIGP